MSRSIVLSFFIVLLVSIAGFSSPINKSEIAKLHPLFQKIIAEKESNLQSLASYTGTTESQSSFFPAIIYTSNTQAVAARGIHINSHFGNFVTARLQVSNLTDLVKLNDVSYLEPGIANISQLDVSVPNIGASLLHAGFVDQIPYKGEHAIVLIYDSGIDWKHQDFRDPMDPSKSRILSIWDQTLSPISGENSPAGLNYGVEYTNSDINDELDGSPANFVRSIDTNGHGTHVAGIAAGNGSSSNGGYIGVAPKADIIVVKGGNGSYSETRMIDGITYAENKSTQLGKPVIINFSIGGQQGPHDGSRAYEVAIDEFSQTSGRVVVVSAGNDGDDNIHIGGTLSTGDSKTIFFTVPQYTPNTSSHNDEFIFSLWFDGLVTTRATVQSPNGVSLTANYSSNNFAADQSDGRIQLWNVISPLNNQKNITLNVYDENANQPPAPGQWTLTLDNATGMINYDGWLASRKVGNETVVLQNGNSNMTVSMPATSNNAITVASYVTKWRWPSHNGSIYIYSSSYDNVKNISDFSSIGPTRDGRQKPDIAAPGQGINSTMSSASTQSTTRINPDEKHFLTQGTSMAAPHVAGTVALLLGINKTLSISQIKDLLTSTTNADIFTGSTPNYSWGYGKLDALRAMVELLSPGANVLREVLAYDGYSQLGFYITGERSVAVRFTPSFSGKLTGIYLDTIDKVSGAGPLLCSVHDNAAGSIHGIPGNQIGNIVEKNLSGINYGTYNYINMVQSNVDVIAGMNYHVVLSLPNAADSIRTLIDDGSISENRTSIKKNGNWYNMGDVSSGYLTPYNLHVRAEISSISGFTSISDLYESVPSRFELYQNFPNPFNPDTNIYFDLQKNSLVHLKIFNLQGQLVTELINKKMAAGKHSIKWNSKNAAGHIVASGVYIYRLSSKEFTAARKMLLLR